jgi:branched-chain amino acid transport system ATP-binding protein
MIALTLDNIAINFGGVKAVSDVSLTVAEGERRVMLGPNGAGKTTLFNIVGGQMRPKQGRVALFGRDVTRLSPNERAHAGIARTFQITSLFAALTVEENVYLAVQGTSPNGYTIWRAASSIVGTTQRVEQLLTEWRFIETRYAIVRELSYGEQRKLEIVMALAQQPRLLLLDEPTAGLSTSESENVVALVKSLGRDVTVLVIEHDMDVAFEIGERFTIMNQGRVVADGDAQAIRNDTEIQSIYFGEVDA